MTVVSHLPTYSTFGGASDHRAGWGRAGWRPASCISLSRIYVASPGNSSSAPTRSPKLSSAQQGGLCRSHTKQVLFWVPA